MLLFLFNHLIQYVDVCVDDWQGELADYNLVVERASTGAGSMIEATGTLEMDIDQLRATNERDERALESLFEQKHSRLKLKTDLETQLTVLNCHDAMSFIKGLLFHSIVFVGGEAVCGCASGSNACCDAPKVIIAISEILITEYSRTYDWY